MRSHFNKIVNTQKLTYSGIERFIQSSVFFSFTRCCDWKEQLLSALHTNARETSLLNIYNIQYLVIVWLQRCPIALTLEVLTMSSRVLSSFFYIVYSSSALTNIILTTVDKKVMIRHRYNRIQHPTPDTKRERNRNEPPHDKPTKWHVHPAKPQISLGIRQV